MTTSPPSRPGGNPVYLVVVCLVAALGGLLFCFDTAVISGTVGFFEQEFALLPAGTGWVASSALVGCFFGALGAGALSDRFGRKKILLLSAVFFLFSAGWCGLARTATAVGEPVKYLAGERACRKARNSWQRSIQKLREVSLGARRGRALDRERKHHLADRRTGLALTAARAIDDPNEIELFCDPCKCPDVANSLGPDGEGLAKIGVASGLHGPECYLPRHRPFFLGIPDRLGSYAIPATIHFALEDVHFLHVSEVSDIRPSPPRNAPSARSKTCEGPARVDTMVPLGGMGAVGRKRPPTGASHRGLPQGPLTSAYRGRPAGQGVVAFLGIPYARPPIGRLRWREAMPPEPSAQVVDASGYGPTCRQLPDENEPASLRRQDEDCLSLNVWTRQVDGPLKPVLLWIHGGANVSGGTADPLYDGQHFVRDNDVVLVSINYRLGPFGFLDLEEVGGSDYRRSRNLGLLDQLAALRWVRTTIAAFGGDTANVTVFGESAGGSAIMRLLAMPLARGLFAETPQSPAFRNCVIPFQLAS